MRFWWFFFQLISYSTISFLILEVIFSWMSCGEVFGVCHEINPLYIQAVPRPLRSALMEHRQGNKSTDENIFYSNSIIYYKYNRNKKAQKCLVSLWIWISWLRKKMWWHLSDGGDETQQVWHILESSNKEES